MNTENKKSEIYIAISSDRGLCGALHSNIGRAVKAEYEQKADDQQVKIITVGEKSKAFLQRYREISIINDRKLSDAICVTLVLLLCFARSNSIF